MKNKISFILSYLDELFPNPKCELEYSKDYELLIAVMLSAQTTDKRVNVVTRKLFEKYDTVKSLASAPLEDVKNIIRSIGFVNKKASNVILIAKYIDEYCNGVVPNNREILESLPGVGHKTANVFLGEIYNEPCMAVDTHVSRVSKRLNLAKENDSVEVIEKKLMKLIDKNSWTKAHKQFVLFGRYHCTAKNPNCDNCSLRPNCSYFKSINKIKSSS